MRKLGDVGLGFVQGAAGGAKALTDAAGAGNRASRALGAISSGAGKLMSQDAQDEIAARQQKIKEAEASGSTLNEIGAHLGGIAEAPARSIAQGAGSILPTMAAAYLTRGRSLGALTGVGAAQGAGAVKGSIYDAVEQRQIDAGMTPEQAAQAATRAQEYTGENAANIGVGAGLGVIASRVGAEGAVLGTTGARGALRKIGTAAGEEAITEGAQGGQERYAANVAEQRQGFDTPTFQGVAGQAVGEGVIGGIVGGGVSGGVQAMEMAQNTGQKPAQEPPVSEPPRTGAIPSDTGGGNGVSDPGVFDPNSAVPEPTPAPATKSQAMGLNPAAGPVSAAAAVAVDNGATETVQRQMAEQQAAEQAKKDGKGKKTGQEASSAAPAPVAPAAPPAPATAPAGPLAAAVQSIPQPPGALDAQGQAQQGQQQATGAAPDAGATRGTGQDPGQAGAGAVPDAVPEPTGGAEPALSDVYDQGIEKAKRAFTVSASPDTETDDEFVKADRARIPSTAQPADAGTVQAAPEGKPDTVDAPAHATAATSPTKGKNALWREFAPETGTKGIPRAEMPQIKAEHRGAMTNFLNARGIMHEQVELSPAELKPTQAEYAPLKVSRAASFKGPDRSILVSSDGYIVDGHHQWLAKLATGQPVKAIRLNAPVDQLLPMVKEFPSATAASGAVQPSADSTPKKRDRIAKTVKSLETMGATRMANLDARRKRLQEDLAIARQHPNINERDQAAHVAELTDEIDALNEAEPFAKQADDKDLHDGINRGMLKQARQELDAAVKNGDVTPDQAQAAVIAAGKSGNAASASEIVLNAVDGIQPKEHRPALTKTPEVLYAEKVDDMGVELARQIAGEASEKDFAPTELPAAIAQWAKDGKVAADDLRRAVIKSLEKRGLSDGRMKQIRDALNPAKEPRSGLKRMQEAKAKKDADPAAGKWFGSKEKAAQKLADLGLTDTHEVVRDGLRFELRKKVPSDPAKYNSTAADKALDAVHAIVNNPIDQRTRGYIPIDRLKFNAAVAQAKAAGVKVTTHPPGSSGTVVWTFEKPDGSAYSAYQEKSGRGTWIAHPAKGAQAEAPAAASNAQAKPEVAPPMVVGDKAVARFKKDGREYSIPVTVTAMERWQGSAMVKIDQAPARTNWRDGMSLRVLLSNLTPAKKPATPQVPPPLPPAAYTGKGPTVIVNKLGADGLTDAERAAGKKPYTDAPVDKAKTPEIVKGEIGQKFSAGQVAITSSGRQTTPFPKVDISTNGKANNTLKRVDQWLINNALAEAQSRGDTFNERQFQSVNNLNVTQSDKDSAEQYLFGEQPKVVPSILRPLVQKAKPVASANTIFTEDAAAAARARLKAKIGRLSSGLDPETMLDGITLAGYHIEKGARTFAAYAKAMIDDLGDGVKPYLKSWYMGVKYDPRASGFDGMDSPTVVDAADLGALDTTPKKADTATTGDDNATRKLDSASPRPLEGAPSSDVRAPEPGGQAPASPDASGRPDGAGNAQPDGAGNGAPGGVGAGPGAVPVPAAGAKPGAKNAKKPRVSRAPRTDAGLFEPGPAGGIDTGNQAPNAPAVPAPQIKAEDFTIEDDLGLGEGGQKTKFQNNVAAIRLLQELAQADRMATPDEQKVLAKYVGWGGLPQAFDPDKADWASEHATLKEIMTPDQMADARMSTRYAHYTSRPIIVDGIYAALRRFGFTGGKTLEAGAGVGNFLGLMPTDMRSAGRFTAIEREPFSSAIARHLYPKQIVRRDDFTEFKGNDGYFDAAVGNPPFASDTQVDRSGRKHLSGLSLHNYFFAKAVDMLREGGIMGQVVTNSFLDAKSDAARKYISDRTVFLGAIRLPNNAFSKNAGTEVTTDLIFLQKRPDSEIGGIKARADAKRWLDTGVYTDKNGSKVALNQYFIDNPGMMLGDFGAYGTMYGPGQPALISRPGQDTMALLKAAVEKLPEGVYKSISQTGTQAQTSAAIQALTNPPVKEGGYFLQGDKLMQRLPDLGGESRGMEITAATQWTEKTKLGDQGYARIKALAELRGTTRALIAAEMADKTADMQRLRADLNRQYDAYAQEHGLINDPGTLRVFDDDPDFPLLASLEHGYTPAIGIAAAKRMGIKPVPSKARKSPIFTQRVVAAREQVKKVESAADALDVSMAERGKLDAAYIGELLGKDASDVLEELSTGTKPLLFLDPSTNEYVLRDAYLSGNVRAKLAQAKAAGMYANVTELEKVQPADVASHEISARLGSPWIPTEVYEDFAKDLYGEQSRVVVGYIKANSSYQLAVFDGSDTAMHNTWGTRAYPGDAMLSALMNNRSLKVTYRDAEGKTHTDVEATEAANIKGQEIRERFNDWLFRDPDRSELLTKAYNETNNNYVTRVYDGSHMSFPGKVPDAVIKFRRHQRNAIARIVQDRTALLDHVVGAGKTFTIVSGAMELKRTGLARKPMVAVPNHLVKQWAADFYRLYPGANVLTATKKDFQKINRRKFLAKIATGDWDAVVIAHSSFGFIKPAPEFEARFNEQQIAEIVATIQSVEDGDGDKQVKKRTVKQLEGIKERLQNRIRALRDKPMDDLLDFEQIGVDQLFVDEAHMFKNLMYSTKMQGVSGMQDPSGSQRAYDMYVKAHQIYEKNGRGQGVVFATGTPVSNSLAEMYHMMRYLMPSQMKELGFESFDAWANTFAAVEQSWMQAPSGDGFKASNRMSNFVNTPELLKIFDQVSDTVTMEDIQKAYSEENDGAEFPLPKLKGGRRTPVSLDKSATQEAYMQDIAKRAKAIEQRKGPPKKGDDNILVVMGDARKAAMDIRLVDHTITERERGGRIDRATDEAVARYRQYDKVKGTQIIFSDLGTPIKHAKAELKEYEALQERIAAGTDDVVNSATFGNESALEIMEDVEAAQAELAGKGPDWLSAVQSALRGFSVYDDFKAALIEKGVPEAEIAFIHDYNTDDQKAALFAKVNAGQIRFLMGSTAKLGAGTNVQERLVAEHHLDVPWRPSDVEQREGRIIRQGNKLMDEVPGFEIEILAYVTKDTLDMRMWQVQEAKLKMINQLRMRKIDRNIENAFEDMELSAGEMQAAATGDINLLKEIQLRNDVKKLEQQKRSFDGQRNDLLSRKKRVADRMARLPGELKEAQRSADLAKRYTQDLQDNPVKFSMTIDGKEYTDPAEAGAYLDSLTSKREPVMKDGAPVLDGEGNPTDRAAPISIDINGEIIKNRNTVAEMFAEARGDRAPIKWEWNGQVYRRRSKLATAIRQNVVDAIADETTKPVGKIGPYDVAVEGQALKDGRFMVDVTLSVDGNVELSNDFSGSGIEVVPENVISVSENLIHGAASKARWIEEDLAKAKRDAADLEKTPVPDAWPGEAKLEAARAAHKEVLGKLKQKNPDYKPGMYLVTNDKGQTESEPRNLSADDIAQLLGHGWKIEPVANDAAFSRGNPFYSALTREVAKIPAKSQGAGGWQLNLIGLVKAGKVKQDELEWSGVTDWLRLQEGRVTREQVVEFLEGNGVRVTETVLGGSEPKVITSDKALQRLRDGLSVGWRRGDQVVQMHSPDSIVDDGSYYRELVDSGDAEWIDTGTNVGGEVTNTKYGNYTVPGGTNYRELLLTLPVKTTADPARAEYERWASERGLTANATFTEERYKRETGNDAPPPRTMTDMGKDRAANYQSSHWDAPNVLAHIRVDDRTDADGKRVLFVNEIQSDWGQEGKKRGFAGMSADESIELDALTKKLFGGGRLSDAEAARRTQLEAKKNSPIPIAPFVDKTDKWVSLAVKRIVKMAVDDGYDRVAFISGDQAADLYDLSKQIGEITYDFLPDDTVGHLKAYSTDGGKVIDQAVRPDALPDFIGKEAADRLMNNPTTVRGYTKALRGIDLKVGGEGMKAFYDKIVPSVAKDVVRKLGGGQMETVRVAVGNKPENPEALQFQLNHPEIYGEETRRLAAQVLAGRTAKQPGFTITPAMKDRAADGVPLFRRGADTGMPIAQARLIIAPIAKRLNIDVRVVATPAGLPIPAPSDVRALYINGDIYVVAGNVKTRAEVLKAVGHEAIAHLGLRALKGREDWNKMMNQMQLALKMGNKQLRDLQKTVRAAYVDDAGEFDLTPGQESDEIAAAAVEQAIDPVTGEFRPGFGFLKGLFAKVAEWLRSVGIDVAFTNLELQGALVNAQRYLEQGARAPEGQAVAASRDAAMARTEQIDTPAFRKWFGDSKVVDADGKPMVVYHGSPQGGFDEFDVSNVGVFFSSRYDVAASYAGAYDDVELADPDAEFYDENQGVYSVYIKIENPMVVDWGGKDWGDGPEGLRLDEWANRAKRAGHDGLIVEGVVDTGWLAPGLVSDKGDGTVYVVFRPEQIKSAIGNRGTFDPKNPDIRFARGAGQVVTDIKQRAGNKLSDYRALALQAIGRRQMVDLYGKELPQLVKYNELMQAMDADKNEAGASADGIADRWGKLKDERQLAELMHDATLAQIDPEKDYVEGDDQNFYDALKAGFAALSPEAKKLYVDARENYRAHHANVRAAIRDRIERSELRGPRKAELLQQMDAEFFKQLKGVYFPLARFGDYVVIVRDPDTNRAINVSRAETMNEAQALRESLIKAYPSDRVGEVLKSKEFSADRDMVGRGFMQNLYDALGEKEMDDGKRAELEDMLGQLYLSALPDLSWAKHGIHRKGTPGFSQDARRAFAQNMFHGARYLAKVRYSDLLENELSDAQKMLDVNAESFGDDQPKLQDVLNEMQKRHEAAMNPTGNALSTALTSLGFVFHLGLSPASAMVNMTQTALVAYPIMGAKWGFDKAAAALVKASGQAAANKNDMTSTLTAEERRAFDEAVRSGVIDVTMAHDLAGISQGDDAKVTWKLRPVMKWASFLFHHAEKFNRQVTFVASYRLAREAGTPPRIAYAQAVKATYDGHFDYSATNRARILQGNTARVVLLFKQYAQNMVYILARQGYLAVKGANPRERAEARKALGGLLALHAAAAGVLGLPMVTTLLAAASMIGGSDDEPWDAEVALRNMLADAFGDGPADVLARGLSRLTPFDISGRVGLDRLIFPDVQEGLEGQRLGESAMAAALGPVAGIGINVLRGVQQMADGDWARGLEAMAPSALRGPIKALRYADEGAIDRTGKTILDDINPVGIAGQALGFSPSDVRLATEAKSAVHQADARLSKRRGQLMRHYSMAAIAGDEDGMADAREDIKAFNERNPARRINPMQLAASVRTRRMQIAQAKGGVYLSRSRRDAMDAGAFGMP